MDTPSTSNGDHLGTMICGCIICSSPSSTSAELTFCWFRKMPSYGGEKRPKMKMGANRILKKKRASSSQETKRPPCPLPRTLLQSTSSTREHSFGETAVLCQRRIWESATGMCEICDDLFLQGFWCFCRRHPKKKTDNWNGGHFFSRQTVPFWKLLWIFILLSCFMVYICWSCI